MGLRAVRLCLTRRDLLRTQLRALYRASAFGPISIMVPMIASVWEMQEIRKSAALIRRDLAADGTAFDPKVPLGAMIETPAAALLSDELTAECDFFSIGTNDLTQYTLAIDRQNQSLDNIYDPHHEAVLRMIQRTIECAHDHGAWCGICGELGADMELTRRFIQMGIDELSVSPVFTLELRKKIRETE